jgi:hypothetical protein
MSDEIVSMSLKLQLEERQSAFDQDIARRKYLSGRVESDGTFLIRTADIP